MWTTKQVFDDGSVLYYDASGNVVQADPAPGTPSPGSPSFFDKLQSAAEKAAGTGLDAVIRSLNSAVQPKAPAVTAAPSSAQSSQLVSVAMLAAGAFLLYKLIRG